MAENCEEQKPAVFFDVDGTWFRRELTDYWFTAAAKEGLIPESVNIELGRRAVAYKRREIPFCDFQEYLVGAILEGGHFKGVRVDTAERVAADVVERYGKYVHRFTQKLSNAAEEARVERVIISGALWEVVRAFAAYHRIKTVRATRFAAKDGLFVGDEYIEWVTRKGKAVLEVAQELGLDLSESVAIGDTASDIPMLEAVGFPVCFNPTADLLVEARRRRWPCVLEKKSHHIYLCPDADGDLIEVGLADILPKYLTDFFTE